MAFDEYAAPRTYFAQGGAPAHVVAGKDKDRIQSYDFYDNAFHNNPNTYKIMQRGQDAAPIYLPSVKKCINAVNRFLAVDFGFTIDSTEEAIKQQLYAMVTKLFARELFFAKFRSQKRYGLIRGDSFWHMVADESKGPAGAMERISISELDPRNVFPIYADNDAEKKIGYHLVDIIIDPTDPNGTRKTARRQTYRKVDGRITSELSYWEPDKWDDRNLKPKDLKPMRVPGGWAPKDLPPEITALPVYHNRNERVPGKPFGMSEVYGMERIVAAANQAVSDEELALAMSGLGIFFTTSGPPTRDGQIVPWELGPARVVEGKDGSTFDRVSGVTSVAPMLDHMHFMLGEMQGGMAIPDIAAGRVDVTVAESGISLLLQLAPLLASNEEKEGSMIGVYDQMFHDLVHMWMVAFEGVPFDVPAEMLSVVGDPMPKNRTASISELISLKTAGIITAQESRLILVREHGYKLTVDADGQVTANPIINEERLLAGAQGLDPFLRRLAEEDGTTGQNTNNGSVDDTIGGLIR